MPTKRKALTPAEKLRRLLFDGASPGHAEADRLRCLRSASPGPLSKLQRQVIDAHLGGTKDPDEIARQLGIEPPPRLVRDAATAARISADMAEIGHDVPAKTLEGPLPAPDSPVEVVFRQLIRPSKVDGLDLWQRRVLDVCLYPGEDGKPQAEIKRRKKIPSPESIAACLPYLTPAKARSIMRSLESRGASGVAIFKRNHTKADAEADLKASGAWREGPRGKTEKAKHVETVEQEGKRNRINQRMVAARMALQKGAFTPYESDAERILYARIMDELELSPNSIAARLYLSDEYIGKALKLEELLYRDNEACPGCGYPMLEERWPGDPCALPPSGKRETCSGTCAKRLWRAMEKP